MLLTNPRCKHIYLIIYLSDSINLLQIQRKIANLCATRHKAISVRNSCTFVSKSKKTK